MSKILEFGSEARNKITKGINKLSDAVTSTLGPNGRNVIYKNGTEFPLSTKDGVTVAKQVSLEDPIEDLGVQMLKQAAIRTGEDAGDGTTTSTLLAQEMIKSGLTYLNNGANAVEIKRGIDKAVDDVVKCLKDNISTEITSESQLEQVATISSNNDKELGEIIASAFKEVGKDGKRR